MNIVRCDCQVMGVNWRVLSIPMIEYLMKGGESITKVGKKETDSHFIILLK